MIMVNEKLYQKQNYSNILMAVKSTWMYILTGRQKRPRVEWMYKNISKDRYRHKGKFAKVVNLGFVHAEYNILRQYTRKISIFIMTAKDSIERYDSKNLNMGRKSERERGV